MDAIEELLSQDPRAVVMTLVILVFAVVAVIEAVGKISKAIGKPVKWVQQNDKDHELLVETAKRVEELAAHHNDDVAESDKHDKELHEELYEFAKEIRDSIQQTQAQMDQFTENRVHDREQSFEIQGELTANIKAINEDGQKRDEQIRSLMMGMMELLGDKIDQRFSKYVSLGGIPENEVDEFNGIYAAYARTGGNHKRKEKYEYVTKHMKVIPVEVNLLGDRGEE